jgi:hypothetical protein
MSTETRATKAVEQSEQVRDEWIAAVDSLYREAESWAREQGWTTSRRRCSLEEPRLGPYQVWRLSVRTPEGRIVFRPVARYIVGATGRFDVIAPPSRYASMMMGRQTNGTWQIHPFGDSEIAQPWSKSNFIELVRTMIESAHKK